MDRHSPFACPHRHKRNHDEIEGHSAFRAGYRLPSPLPSPRRTFAAESSSSTTARTTPPRTTERFAGDGLDFRRPAIARWNTMPPPIIDLTNLSDEEEGREDIAQPAQNQPQAFVRATGPPRFPRDIEIVDLSNDSSPFPHPRNESGSASARSDPQSPEVQFVSARPRPPRPRPVPRPHQHVPRPPPQRHPGMGPLRNVLLESEDDEDGLEYAIQGDLRRVQHMIRASRIPMNRPTNRLNGLFRTTFFQPPELNFEAVGFQIGGVARAPSPVAPVYDAPPPAPEGFTRSPEEDDVLICPNCKDELCVGEDDIKKQVWIVRSCGHIYCGECATNRSITKRKGKSAINAQAFKECVVEGCGKKVSNKTAMVQLFL